MDKTVKIAAGVATGVAATTAALAIIPGLDSVYASVFAALTLGATSMVNFLVSKNE